jgi:tetratricopeptide (TPR) repeat protein
LEAKAPNFLLDGRGDVSIDFMHEHAESTGRAVLKPHPSTSIDRLHASLQAVRAAQEAARVRARRETRRTRVWFAVVTGCLVAGVVVFGPRLRRHRVSSAAVGVATAVAATEPSASAAVAAAVAAPAPAPVSGPELPAPESAPIPQQLAAPEVAAPAAARAATSEPTETAGGEGCRPLLRQRRWRGALDACTADFEARPTDATLALGVAQAQHARSDLSQAGVWASKAIALDPALPEAYAILAHAEARAGRRAAAVDAYRRYLALAPRGWHAAEARSAIRKAARAAEARPARTEPEPLDSVAPDASDG